MSYSNYLIHFNKNHSPKNGQFVSGDGDADGVRDDHHNYSKNKVTSPKGYKIKKEPNKERNSYLISSTSRKNSSSVDKMNVTLKKKLYLGRNGPDIYTADKKISDEKQKENRELSEKYREASLKAMKAYEKTGRADSAAKILSKELGDVSYKAVVGGKKYKDVGDRYVEFALEVYGKNKVYSILGSSSTDKNNKFVVNENSLGWENIDRGKRKDYKEE